MRWGIHEHTDLTFIIFLLVSSFIGDNADPSITVSLILPFHKTVEEDDENQVVNK